AAAYRGAPKTTISKTPPTAAARRSLRPVSQARGNRPGEGITRIVLSGSFSSEDAFDDGGGEGVGVAFERRSRGRGLRVKTLGGLADRALDFAPRVGEDRGAAVERRAPRVVHLPVHVGASRACFRLELVSGRLRP